MKLRISLFFSLVALYCLHSAQADYSAQAGCESAAATIASKDQYWVQNLRGQTYSYVRQERRTPEGFLIVLHTMGEANRGEVPTVGVPFISEDDLWARVSPGIERTLTKWEAKWPATFLKRFRELAPLHLYHSSFVEIYDGQGNPVAQARVLTAHLNERMMMEDMLEISVEQNIYNDPHTKAPYIRKSEIGVYYTEETLELSIRETVNSYLWLALFEMAFRHGHRAADVFGHSFYLYSDPYTSRLFRRAGFTTNTTFWEFTASRAGDKKILPIFAHDVNWFPMYADTNTVLRFQAGLENGLRLRRADMAAIRASSPSNFAIRREWFSRLQTPADLLKYLSTIEEMFEERRAHFAFIVDHETDSRNSAALEWASFFFAVKDHLLQILQAAPESLTSEQRVAALKIVRLVLQNDDSFSRSITAPYSFVQYSLLKGEPQELGIAFEVLNALILQGKLSESIGPRGGLTPIERAIGQRTR